MAEIKSRLMDFGGRMVTSLVFDEDQMTNITQFFFTHDMTKSDRSIFDQMDKT